jgi:cytochrome c peroxidase
VGTDTAQVYWGVAASGRNMSCQAAVRIIVAACTVVASVACSDGASPAGSAGAGGSAGSAAGSAGGSAGSAAGSAGLAAGSADSGGGVSDDPDPVITKSIRAALTALRYDADPPAADPSNRVGDDEGAQAFGHRLFFETALSGRLLERDNDGSTGTLGRAGEPGRVSCSGCHVPTAGFVDARSPHLQISLAALWARRRTPTLLEVAAEPLYNWDGRRDSIWGQAIGVMEAKGEFNSSRLFVAEQLFRLYRDQYESVFGAMPQLDDPNRFPQLEPVQAGCDEGPDDTAACRGKPGDKADYDGMTPQAQVEVTTVTVNAAKAIAAYVRQLRCGASRFEDWLAGDDQALSRSEQRGAALFVGRAGCSDCHSGPNLTDGKFHNVGLRPATVAVAFTDKDDRGAAAGLSLLVDDPLNSKGAFSDGDRGVLPDALGPELEGAFRTPTLRCITNQPSFMHTAQLATLEEVVDFFVRGGDPAGFPGENELKRLDLDAREQADLLAFLQALQGAGPGPDLSAPLPD